ncbi:S8 family serine peptidase [uncultured Pseudomonas sp.]|uniref:S8 family serine peptidase n=1 Tax=uncultured Pseudomonas sp. TaxID=114707 RepID=UPI002589220A|nr:S8 family serine peptidase [uncultured Pseudomonas sp.]
MTDLKFVHYRSYRFDGLLLVRCTGSDLENIKRITYQLHRKDGNSLSLLQTETAPSHASSGELTDYGCPITFKVDAPYGRFAITPTVTWIQKAGGATRTFAPLEFDIQPGESTRTFLGSGRSRRDATSDPAARKMPQSFELVDDMLQQHDPINFKPAVGPLLVKFAEGGAERFAADMQADSNSLLMRRWPGLEHLLQWRQYLEPEQRDIESLQALRDYWQIEQPASMNNDTFIVLGKHVAQLDYVEHVHLPPVGEQSAAGPLLLAGALATVLTGVAVHYGNKAYDESQPTPDFEALQRYLDEPDALIKGLNIRKAWEKEVKGRGARVHLVDGGLYPNHEELRGNSAIKVIVLEPNGSPDHGSSSAGVIIASANGTGVTGISHQSEVFFYNSEAGRRTLDQLLIRVMPGDVVTIVRQVHDAKRPEAYLPTLHSAMWSSVIERLVDRGAVVVCAAGNGFNQDNSDIGAVAGTGVNLSRWRYFDATKDIGAIVVGACESWSGHPHRKSNYNYPYRMLNAWGDSVVTLGLSPTGFLQDKDGNDRDYTNIYGGTSSATAMIGGALTLIQSYAMEQHHLYLNAYEMHMLLMQTGYTDAMFPHESQPPMGVRPNVYAALRRLDRILDGGRFYSPQKNEG